MKCFGRNRANERNPSASIWPYSAYTPSVTRIVILATNTTGLFRDAANQTKDPDIFFCYTATRCFVYCLLVYKWSTLTFLCKVIVHCRFSRVINTEWWFLRGFRNVTVQFLLRRIVVECLRKSCWVRVNNIDFFHRNLSHVRTTTFLHQYSRQRLEKWTDN